MTILFYSSLRPDRSWLILYDTLTALSVSIDCGVFPFGLFLPRLLSFTVDLLISAYTAYWSTWSVHQTH